MRRWGAVLWGGVPAYAGMTVMGASRLWIPAYAGMTNPGMQGGV